MQEFKPLDFTKLSLDGQVKVITVTAPQLPAKTNRIPYVLLALSLTALAAVIAYYNKLLKSKEQEGKQRTKKFSYE
jgi:hypothetical protein